MLNYHVFKVGPDTRWLLNEEPCNRFWMLIINMYWIAKTYLAISNFCAHVKTNLFSKYRRNYVFTLFLLFIFFFQLLQGTSYDNDHTKMDQGTSNKLFFFLNYIKMLGYIESVTWFYVIISISVQTKYSKKTKIFEIR